MRQPLLTLSAENFRSFRAVEVALNPLNVLVGPNEAGKSNFLDLIRFLADSVRTDLVPAVEARGGFERVRFRGTPSGPVKLQVTADVTRYSSVSAPDEYALTVRQSRLRNTRTGETRLALSRTESFRFKRTRGRGRRITIQGSNVQLVDTPESGKGEETTRKFGLRSDALGLATLPKLSTDEGGDEVARIADMFATFRVFDLDVTAARRPSPIDRPYLGRDVGKIVNAKEELRRALRPAGARRSPDYRESDAPLVATAVRELHLASFPGGRSDSYQMFRDHAERCGRPSVRGDD